MAELYNILALGYELQLKSWNCPKNFQMRDKLPNYNTGFSSS